VELTLLAMVASLMMGLGAACLFIFAVRKNWLHDIEDAKYHVFWSDLERPADSSKEKASDGNGDKSGHKD